MSFWEIIAVVCLGTAAIPAVLFAVNLLVFRAPRNTDYAGKVSILIPARNEEARIAGPIEAALRTEGCEFEVLVGDDNSTDRTAEIVTSFAERDPRLQLVSIPDLPDGWAGKPHACSALAAEATGDYLLFVDADVELTPDAAARLAGFLEEGNIEFVSGVPAQRTPTIAEKIFIPLIDFVLLGFLPILGMRRSKSPAFGAACGQLIMVDRDTYHATGGHEAIRPTLNDGVALARSFRRAGHATDLCDITPLATCRMCETAGEITQSFSKTAPEGLAAKGTILPFTFLLGFGHLLPPILLLGGWITEAPLVAAFAGGAFLLSLIPRLLGVFRFRQSLIGALLHPVGIAWFLGINWYAFAANLRGRPIAWRGRAYGAQTDGANQESLGSRKSSPTPSR